MKTHRDYETDIKFIVMVALVCTTLWAVWEFLL